MNQVFSFELLEGLRMAKNPVLTDAVMALMSSYSLLEQSYAELMEKHDRQHKELLFHCEREDRFQKDHIRYLKIKEMAFSMFAALVNESQHGSKTLDEVLDDWHPTI